MKEYLSAHWAPIMSALGIWVVVAATIATRFPKPKEPTWKVIVYTVLVDWPSYLPALNGRGIFGLPINIPFLSVSAREAEVDPSTESPLEPPAAPAPASSRPLTEAETPLGRKPPSSTGGGSPSGGAGRGRV